MTREELKEETIWGTSVLEMIQPQMAQVLQASRIPSELLNTEGVSGSLPDMSNLVDAFTQHLQTLPFIMTNPPPPPLVPVYEAMQSLLDQPIIRNDDQTIHVEYTGGEWNVDVKPNYRERIDEDVDWYGFAAKTMHICKKSKHPKTLCGRKVLEWDHIKTHMDPDSLLDNACKTCYRIEYSPPAGFYKERKL